MKRFSAIILSLVLLCCVWTVALADDNASEPEIKKPVRITVVDENGARVSGANVRITDSAGDVLDTWKTDGSEHALFLREGEYTVEYLSVPEGYLEEAAGIPFTVELTAEETATDYVGSCTLDHSHAEICSNSGHIGLELYEINGSIAFCFNHGRRNPTADSRYRMLTATPELMEEYALNKSDSITKEALYDHVLGIMWAMDAVKTQYDLDETVARYLAYMAIKNYTDPKCFYEFNDEGESLLVRDEKGIPVRDENGRYVFAEGGTVLGAMMHHVKAETGNPLPEDYIAAYNDLIATTDHPDNYYLYLYYPIDFSKQDGGSFQCLLSAKQVEAKTVAIAIRPSALFEITAVWNDIDNVDLIRPAAADVASFIHLYADGEEVTEQYRDRIAVEENDNVYTVRISDLPKLNADNTPIVYTLLFDQIEGYEEETTVVANGGSITLTHNPFAIDDRPQLRPLKPTPFPVPVRPIKPGRQTERP